MKAIISTVASIIMMTAISNNYFVPAIVSGYNEYENCYVMVDNSGEEWLYEGDYSNQFCIGDRIVIEYDNMGTDDIYDDEIVNIIEVEP